MNIYPNNAEQSFDGESVVSEVIYSRLAELDGGLFGIEQAGNYMEQMNARLNPVAAPAVSNVVSMEQYPLPSRREAPVAQQAAPSEVSQAAEVTERQAAESSQEPADELDAARRAVAMAHEDQEAQSQASLYAAPTATNGFLNPNSETDNVVAIDKNDRLYKEWYGEGERAA